METALDSFFVSLPQAFALWLVLLLVIAGAAALLAVPRRAPAVAADPDPDHRRYCDEVSVAAERASATAGRRRAEWAAAREQADAAWAAFDAADRAARESTKAAAYPLMSRSRKPGDNLDRQRYLHHAATAACRNRLISIAQLNDILAHRGWNPRLHPVVQEGLLRNAIRDHQLAGYRTAVERERAAWRQVESAAEALRSLRLEAAAALARPGTPEPVSDEQWWADQWSTGELPVAA